MPGEDHIKAMQEQLGKEQRELLNRLIADVTAHQREDDLLEILAPNKDGRMVLHRDPSPLFKKRTVVRGPSTNVATPNTTDYNVEERQSS
jgi:hypothetical protein